ncbi:MAG: DUF5680 domain-containing protein [Bacteroidota bacterium]
MVDDLELIKFLITAKTATYASGRKARRYANGLKVFIYKENSLYYRDIYYGSLLDAGFEVIFKNNIPVWSMSYRGGMTVKNTDSKICFAFLRKALENIDKDFPVRGPDHYLEGEFVYLNTYYGNIFDFVGNENITLSGELVYLKKYIGGAVNQQDYNFFHPNFNSLKILTAPK